MKLEVLTGEEKGLLCSFDFDKDVVIGRGADCDVRIKDDESSRHHVKITCKHGVPIVSDMESTNGTLLNGVKMAECRLSEGDEITIGHTTMRVSGLPSRPPSDTTFLRMTDQKSSVVMSMHHEEADVLAGKTTSGSTEEMLRENAILREICGISQLVTAETDSDAVLVSVMDRLNDSLNVDTTCILSRTGDEDNLEIVAKSSRMTEDAAIHVSKTIVNEAVKKGTAILSADPLSDDRFSPSQSIVVQAISSALCCPMKVGNQFRCVLWIDRRRRKEVFNAMDLRLAASVANILGLFLQKREYERESIKRARLAAIGEVIAGLAHYIKNVVTGFKLSIDALKSALKEKRMDYVQTFANSISRQEGRISDLMLNMLSYAKEREPIRARVDVANVVASVADPYRTEFEKEGISFEVERHPDAPDVFVEEMSLHRVFLNLLTNSHASVNAKRDGDEKVIRTTIRPAVGGETTDISFYDTGCGIPRDKLEKIFEAFYSTKGSGGTGLGLAVVHKIINEHGGALNVDSEEGKWTEFKITLPAAKDE